MVGKLKLLPPNPYIKKVEREFGDVIYSLERKCDLPPRSLFLQMGLHLYKFSLEELFICNRFDIAKIDQYSLNRNLVYDELYSLVNYLKTDMQVYQALQKESGASGTSSKLESVRGTYCETGEAEQFSEISFGTVPPDIGRAIQEKIHYIRTARNDTSYQFGLYRKNHDVPFAYAAFSLLDRHYLENLPQLKNTPPSSVYVLTRAYAFPNSPRNAMTVLYSQCFDVLKKNAGASYVLTALNQNLGFSAASLSAANFELVAFSPMKYYYLDGLYSTRRKVECSGKSCTTQKFQSGSIMWFGKSLTGESEENSNLPLVVTDEMYDLH